MPNLMVALVRQTPKWHE